MDNKGFTLIEMICTLAIFSVVIGLALGMFVQSVKISAKYLDTDETLIQLDLAEKYFQSVLMNASYIYLSDFETGDPPDSEAYFDISPDANRKYNSLFDPVDDPPRFFFGSDTNRHVAIDMKIVDKYSILIDILIYDNNDKLLNSRQKLIKCVTLRQLGGEIKSEKASGEYKSPFIFYLQSEGANI